MPKINKNPTKARFIIASPKSSIKPLARTMTSVELFPTLISGLIDFNNFHKHLQLECDMVPGPNLR